MTMDKELIEEFSCRYFAARMPEELRLYLLDRYGEEPLEGNLAPQFFFPAVISDIRKYIRGELEVKLRTELEKLKDRYEELSGIACGMAQDRQRLETENQYFRDFIQWLHLEESCRNFKEKAYPVRDGYGFEYYTL